MESIVVENLSPSIFYCNNPSLTKAAERGCFLLVLTKPETGRRRVMGVRSEKRLGTCHWGPLCYAKSLGFLA